MAKIIAIANQKGGVGKTTTAINLAGSLAEQGFHVLCIDMDPQANLTVGLGINLRNVERSMAEALIDSNVTLDEIIVQTQTPGIDVAPSTIDLSASENVLFSAIGREQALRDTLEASAADRYDYVLIDCPPTLGLLTLNALVASDGVIIPVQTQYYALKGFTALMNVISQIRIKGLNPRLRVLGSAAHVLRRADIARARHAPGDARPGRPPHLREHDQADSPPGRGPAGRPTGDVVRQQHRCCASLPRPRAGGDRTWLDPTSVVPPRAAWLKSATSRLRS